MSRQQLWLTHPAAELERCQEACPPPYWLTLSASAALIKKEMSLQPYDLSPSICEVSASSFAH